MNKKIFNYLTSHISKLNGSSVKIKKLVTNAQSRHVVTYDLDGMTPDKYMVGQCSKILSTNKRTTLNISFLDEFFEKFVCGKNASLIFYSQKNNNETAMIEILGSKKQTLGFVRIQHVFKHKEYKFTSYYEEDIEVDDDAEYLKVSHSFSGDKEGLKLFDKFNQYFEDYKLKPNPASKFKIFTKDSNEGFMFKSFPLEMPANQDIALNYGDSFLSIHEQFLDNIKNKKKGLYLLRGDPGSGKSTYVKILSKYVDKNILYVPPNFISQLESPEFHEFLEDEKNSIIFIEDAEKIVKSRENTDNQVVNTLLNFTDGWLADKYNISFLLTMNCDKNYVDPALLRKGRLILDHDFSKLSIKDAQKLIDFLKIDFKVKEPMSLADIYNFEHDTNYKVEKPNEIGFLT